MGIYMNDRVVLKIKREKEREVCIWPREKLMYTLQAKVIEIEFKR